MLAIETARARMRPFRIDDAADAHRVLFGDAEVMRYMPGGTPRPPERVLAALEQFVFWQALHGFSLWAVEERSSGEFMGQCGLVYLEGHPEIELAYALGRAYWGRGLASELAGAALRCGFETHRLSRVLAFAIPENRASTRVMEKVGMVYQGITTAYHGGTALAMYRIEREAFKPGDAPYRLIE
jgi:ribosomal-protein-alanine N-acetyltransferase